jgi:hypothetical protein
MSEGTGKKLGQLLFLPLLMSGCTTLFTNQQDEAIFRSAISICDVVKQPELYNGKMLNVRGMYFLEPHGGIFYGEGHCSDGLVMVSLADSTDFHEIHWKRVAARLRRSSTAKIPIVYSAVFVMYGFIKCRFPHCSRYGIENAKLIAVR